MEIVVCPLYGRCVCGDCGLPALWSVCLWRLRFARSMVGVSVEIEVCPLYGRCVCGDCGVPALW